MGLMNIITNSTVICAAAAEKPEFSHEVLGSRFYSFPAKCARRSGVMDSIPCLVPERFIDLVQVDKKLMFIGHMRSFNKRVDDSTRLIINVLVKNVSDKLYDETYNEVTLRGYVCKNPVYRKTPFGKEITDILLAVNRSFGKSDYIPVIVWGRNARIASGLHVGDKLHIEGRLQSRDYEKVLDNGEVIHRVAYEVSAYSLVVLS